jgi:predicted Fe-Mo cluster-binding NifX family protein
VANNAEKVAVGETNKSEAADRRIQWNKHMKIGITSHGTGLDADLDPHFGRAAYILLTDTETGVIEAIDNSPSQQAVQGAGIQTARNLADKGVKAVISGHVGPKAFAVLQAAHIEIYSVSGGTAGEALIAFKASQLLPLPQADVQGHWR